MIDLVTASALALPKVELHCHLLGIISPALLARIQRENGPILVEPATLAAAYPVHDYLSFQRWIEILKPYQCATPDLMRPILASYVEALIAQNVVYVEIMLSLTMFPGDRPALLAGLHRWREWANEMEQGRIQIEFVFVLPRTLAPDLLQRDTETLLELHREDLAVGVALVGLETGESIERFRPSFIRFQEAGLGIEIHAGEHAGSESVWDALRNGQPDRLGHALSAFEDEVLIEHIRSKGIHIEFCPASNLRTGAVKSLDEHPVGTAKGLGLSFSLNTDDPGAFGCSMTGEYLSVGDAFGFTHSDFIEIFVRSLAARFRKKLRYLGPSLDCLTATGLSGNDHRVSSLVLDKSISAQ